MIAVTDCNDCPFSGWSTGGHKAAGKPGGRLRRQHTCNLTRERIQWKASNNDYDTFKNCPLKNGQITVELKIPNE